VVPVRTLIAREKTGGSTKSMHLISTSEKEPEVYDIEIIQESILCISVSAGKKFSDSFFLLRRLVDKILSKNY
jgi:hypothetical protein